MERLWLLAVTFVVGTVVTAGYLHRAPRIYVASATLQVEQQEQRVVKFDKIQEQDLREYDMVQTIVQTISSRPVLERVIEKENLTAGFKSPAGGQGALEDAVAKLSSMVNARLRRGTRLIDVSVASTSPALAQKLANSIADQYIRFSFEQQSASSRAASVFLMEEAERLKRKLQDSEARLQAYKEEVKSVSLEDRDDIVTSRLRELSMKANEAKANRTRLEVEYAQIEHASTNGSALLVLPFVANDPAIASISMILSKLQSEFSSLQQRYKPKHPKYIQAAGQLKHWGETLTNSVLKIAQTALLSLENAKSAEAALESALHEQEIQALELSKLRVKYNVLRREIESDRALYDAILTRLKETNLTKDLQSGKVRILQLATMPRSPVSPNVGKILFVGLTGSVGIGLVLVLGIRSLDNSLKTIEQVEEQLHFPVLAAVQYLRELRNPRKQLVLEEQAQSPGAEAFRSLRTSISMLGREQTRRTVLFTSALAGEGKTFCSANYALCLAQAGLRTILIDADLRRPSVERILNSPRSNSPGVTDFLTGQRGLKEIILPTRHEQFFYIPAGTTAPNPAELLAQGGFAALVEEVLRKCDSVVVDSAPIHAVSDTLLLVPCVNTVVMVVRAGETPWKAVFRAIETVQKTSAVVNGVVLNGVKLPRLDAYGYHSYYGCSYHRRHGRKGIYGGR